MFIIQIILLIFFVFAILKVIGRYRAGDLKAGEMVLWVIFWVAAGIVVVVPNSTYYIAHFVGIGRGADLVIYVSLALLFFIFFRLMVRMEKMERNITKLTRIIALNKSDKSGSE